MPKPSEKPAMRQMKTSQQNRKVGLNLKALVLSILLCFSVVFTSQLAYSDDTVDISANILEEASPAPENFEIKLDLNQTISNATAPIVISGLDPFQYVEIYSQSTPILLASGFADAQGVFKVTVTLPPTLEVGDHQIVAVLKLADGTVKNVTLKKFSVSNGGRLGKAKTSSSGSYGGSSEPSITPTPTPTGSTGEPEISIGGIAYLSGLQATTDSSLDLAGKPAQLLFSVRNASDKPYVLHLKFTVENQFGFLVVQPVERDISFDGEKVTRQVRLQTHAIGQWAFYVAKVEVVPPKVVDGVNLRTVTRTNYLFTIPWLFVLFAVVGYLAVPYKGRTMPHRRLLEYVTRLRLMRQTERQNDEESVQ